MDDCIFCKIGRGEIPAQAVYEDDLVIAFDDLSPQAPVHTLVIPKNHYTSLAEEIPPAVSGALLSAVRSVARAKGVSESGFRVIVNSGADANQTVQHLHFHVVGGRTMSHGMVNFAQDA